MSETAAAFDNYARSWQMPAKMPAKTGRRPRHRRSGHLPTLATSLGPPSEGEDGTHGEAVSESDLREADVDLGEPDVDLDEAGAPEAGARQSSSPPPRF